MRGIGKLLIATDTLLRQQIGIGATEARGTELVVYVHQQVVLSSQTYQIVYPSSPAVAGILHETRLYTHNAPFTQQGEEFTRLLHQGMLVHIDPDTHPFLFTILHDTRHV